MNTSLLLQESVCLLLATAMCHLAKWTSGPGAAVEANSDRTALREASCGGNVIGLLPAANLGSTFGSSTTRVGMSSASAAGVSGSPLAVHVETKPTDVNCNVGLCVSSPVTSSISDDDVPSMKIFALDAIIAVVATTVELVERSNAAL